MPNKLEQHCPYCKQKAEWVENKEVYGKNYGDSYMMHLCRKCDARVGCHNNSRKPLGTMANKELRMYRMMTHGVVDPLWKTKKYKRGQVYDMLNSHFEETIHIGESSIEMCKKIIKFIAR